MSDVHDDRMTVGAISGLCIGLILFVILIIILLVWFFRTRKYGIGRKHAKMPSGQGNDIGAMGAHNELYSPAGGPFNIPGTVPGGLQGKNSVGWWPNGPYDLSTTSYWQPIQNQATWIAAQHAQPGTTPYPQLYATGGIMGFGGPAMVGQEPPVIAAHVCPNQATPVPGPWARETQMANFTSSAPTDFYYLGDLSITNLGAVSRHSGLPESLDGQKRFSAPQRGTSSNLTESGAMSAPSDSRTVGEKWRAKVKKAARVSQMGVAQLTAAARRGSKSKAGSRIFHRRRKSRGASLCCGDELAQPGAEVYFNSASPHSDDYGSLDNDAFLNKLESTTFPSAVTPSQLDNRQSHVRFLSTLAASGSNGSLETSGPTEPPYPAIQTDQSSRPFRFPAPGPPVKGWAHQFTQESDDPPANLTSQRAPLEERTTNLHTSKLNSKSDSVPLLIRPPQSSTKLTPEHISRRKCSTESSLLADTPRYRGWTTTPQVRQHSEPRNVSRDPENLLTSADTLTQPSDGGGTSLLTGSMSTLESVLDSLPGRTHFSAHSFDGPADSGYQDSLAGNSLEYSARSAGTAALLSPPSIKQIASPSFFETTVTPRQSGQHPLANQKPRKNTLAEVARQREQSLAMQSKAAMSSLS